jgi:hypothetical protein
MRERRWINVLVGLAVFARVAAIVVLQSHTVPRSTFEHGEIAANLLAGRGFAIRFLGADGPTSQQAPVYPVLVAAAFAVGGVETPRALLLLQLVQAALGGVLVLGVARLARAVAPGRTWVALIACGIAALHPTLIYAATHVQVAGLAAALLTWTLAFAYDAGRIGRRRDAVATGGLFGVLVLTDPILGLALPGIAWAIALGRGGWGAVVRSLGWVAGVGLIVVAPWIARNAAVHGEFVPVKSTFGYAFWQGNCALSAGTDKVVRPSVERVLVRAGAGPRGWNEALWAARHEAGYLDDIALTATDKAALGRLREPERSRVLFRRALADLRAEPGRYPRLCLARLWAFVAFDETNPKTRSLLYRVPHLCLTLAAALGLLLAPRAVRRRIGPTLLVAGLVALFHALTIVSARFHVPIEPLLALWAGAGLGRSAASADGVEGVGVEQGLGVGGVGGDGGQRRAA